jgi:hypothetical protein
MLPIVNENVQVLCEELENLNLDSTSVVNDLTAPSDVSTDMNNINAEQWLQQSGLHDWMTKADQIFLAESKYSYVSPDKASQWYCHFFL